MEIVYRVKVESVDLHDDDITSRFLRYSHWWCSGEQALCVCVCVCVCGWVFYLSTYYYTHNRTLLPVTSSGTVIGGAMVRSVCVCGVCGCVPVWWYGGGCSVYTCTFRTTIN